MRRLAIAILAAVSFGIPSAAAGGVGFSPVYSFGDFGIGRRQFDRPVDVVEDRDENIYVVDQGNNRIEVLDRRGNFVREWGGRGFSTGSFDTPTAISFDQTGDFLIVVDSLNHRIQKFDLKGKLVWAVGSLGSRAGDPVEFNTPRDVAVDRRGNIYVADTKNDRILKLDANGKFLQEWGKFGRRKGTEVTNPVSVACSDEGFGFVFVLNSPECRIQKYDIDGRLVQTWPMHQRGEGALCGPSRIRIEQRRYTVYIADTENDRIILFDKDGEPLGDLREGSVRFAKPSGIFVNTAFTEQVVVADTVNHLIQKFRRTR